MPSLNLDVHEPMRRDERGWWVATAPDGRRAARFPGPEAVLLVFGRTARGRRVARR